MERETHTARLVSITPDAEKQIVYMARVSNPSNQNNLETAPRLIKYLIKHKHWSCLLYTSPSPRDATLSRMPSSA